MLFMGFFMHVCKEMQISVSIFSLIGWYCYPVQNSIKNTLLVGNDFQAAEI
jgi:hypothetical protein